MPTEIQISTMPAPLGHDLDADTLALWRFDDQTGQTVVADVVGTYELTEVGSPLILAGLIGGARQFNGAGDGASRAGSAPALAALTDEYTVEVWIKPDVAWTNKGQVILYGGGGVAYGDMDGRQALNLHVNANKSITFSYHGDNGGTRVDCSVTTADNTVVAGEKVHIGARKSFSGGVWALDLFVNGVLQNSATFTYAHAGGTNGSWAVGYNPDPDPTGAPTDYFLGIIDDMRISSKARLDSEIGQSYRRGIATPMAPAAGGEAGGVLPTVIGQLPKLQLTGGQQWTNGSATDSSRFARNDGTPLLDVSADGKLTFDSFTDNSGTSNATVTVNAITGVINLINGNTSVQVNNDKVTINSIILPIMQEATTPVAVTSIVPANGSFTVYYTGATGNHKMAFVVFN